MIPVYRFFLRVGTPTATAVRIYPVWKDDMSLDYSMESDQKFFRAQLSSPVDLINEDYNKVMAETFGTVFYFDIQKSNDHGVTWSHYWRGKFTLTDCQVNVDDRRIRVRPTVVDQYNEILAGLEKEFDLIKLKPEIEKILIRKRPCIQIYYEGDSKITSIVGGQSFEQDADVPSSVENVGEYLVETCHFSILSSYSEVDFTEVPQDYAADFAQPFIGTITGDGSVLTNSVNTYYLRYFQTEDYVAQGQYITGKFKNGLEVIQRSSGDVKWRFEQENDITRRQDFPIFPEWLPLPEDITFASEVEGVDDLVSINLSMSIYARILCNVETLAGYETYQLYSDDLIGDNRNYRRAIGYKLSGGLTQYAGYSTDPTEWGRRDDGYYFCPPDEYSDYIPIGRSRWVNSSVWVLMSALNTEVENEGNYSYFLNDCYPLASCISVLLAQISPSLRFEATSAYSQFLYSGIDPIGLRDNRIYLTPKSNVIYGEYTTPAQMAPVTLRTLLDFLKNTYQCYWFVDAWNRLRIEHIEFFRRGNTYSGQGVVGIDLTTLEVRRNGKKWAFGQNSFEYDKMEMPERYQFEWMDETTAPFKGHPIDIVSPYVEEGKIEEINVSQVTTDIDYMLLSPSSISPDGFVAMTVEQANAINSSVLFPTTTDEETMTVSLAGYAAGKTCVVNMLAGGTGTATFVFYVGGERIVSAVDVQAPLSRQDVAVTFPAGCTAFSFEVSGTATIAVYSVRVYGDTTSLQVPVVNETFNGRTYKLQNGYLSFAKLQKPYWQYDMPASQMEIDGTAVTVYSIKKNKKQTVNYPVGQNDPYTNQLVKTGIGNGQVQQMSIRLTSRMAKTVLKYDTE